MANFTLLGRLCPAVLCLLLASDGLGQTTGDATRLPARDELRDRNDSGGRNFGDGRDVASRLDPALREARPRLSAHIEDIPSQDSDCGWDTMRLTIRDGNRLVTTYDYCSGYSFGSAQIVTDARDRNYLLLETAEGRGSPPPPIFLTIFEVADGLDERARLLVNEPVTISQRISYDYVVHAPPAGGIIVDGNWNLDPGEIDPGFRSAIPRRSRTSVSIDTGDVVRQ